ncbi:MAG: YifB family Mg chelatase-like AAA ATPase [Clostridium sp.]|nr:YifB family Mg chelatase-like AAA ATPase [Acetatifactor muris]MCM1526048.1 YifB family Mg chelatase-like AAA ATPase [Bacteroides sp.]MCM1562192.1 YifB family Mg chelatase-like AAA ATPase [Clostridium sp.]
MFCRILSGGVVGVEADFVRVEVDIDRGLPSFVMVGSLGSEVRESRERVSVALKNAGFAIPAAHITINLAPADRRKEGTAFDLPIAVGILQSMSFFSETATRDILFLGELGLNGELKKVKGVLPIVRAAAAAGIAQCIVPAANAGEGAVIPGITVRGAENILQVNAFLREPDGHAREEILPAARTDVEELLHSASYSGEDFAQVSGQKQAKRAAEIAAAGFHSLLMTGPPGAGKSMIARRIPGILPPLTREESLEITGIYSVAGLLEEGQALVVNRPFQSPHHTISRSALIGGSFHPRPGLISLSHRGVLFMDELPEFGREVIDSMRQPLEEHRVQIARLGGNLVYPADFMLVGAMNLCPCGYFPDRNRCKCTETQLRKYQGRISGPIVDRIDLWVELQPVELSGLQTTGDEETTQRIRGRVENARARQQERFAGGSYRFNADIQAADMDRFCSLGSKEKRIMEQLYDGLRLGARAYHRILRVARTIADLAGADEIREEDLLEAAVYRPGGGA